MSRLAKYLNGHIVGNVFDRPAICDQQATDRSLLSATPRLVALPETVDDVRKLLKFANQLATQGFSLPVTVRGTGRDKTGASLGDGLILSTAHLNKIEEVDLRGRLVRVQPGITLREFNAALSLHGLCLPIDYDPEATIGSLIANCPNDDASMRYGGIYHYVERAEVVLASGDVVQFSPYNHRTTQQKLQSDDAEGALYRELDQLLERQAETILDRSTRPFDAAGYANITRVRQGRGLNLLPLLFASQGTLGVVVDVILHVETLPSRTRQLLATFPDRKSALRFLEFAVKEEPRNLRLYDMRIMARAAENGNCPSLLEDDLGQGWLVVAKFDDGDFTSSRKIRRCLNVLPGDAKTATEDSENGLEFRKIQSALMSFLNDDVLGERVPIMDDVFVPQHRLSDFLIGLRELEYKLGHELPLYGSYATSNYHLRPEVDCSNLDGLRQILLIVRQYSQLVRHCEGSLTGGSPEGQIKGVFGLPNLSDDERTLYLEVKHIFDPYNILNPDAKLGADLRKSLTRLLPHGPRGLTEA